MFTIRGTLLIYALELVAAVILILSIPPWEQRWVQAGMTVLAIAAVALAFLLGRELEARVERRGHELRKLREITGAVHLSTDFQAIFESVVTGTQELVEFEQATIARTVDHTHAELFAMSGTGGLRRGQPIDLSMPRFWDAVRRSEPVAYDVELQISPEDTFGMSAIRRQVILPLRSGERVLGTLNLGSRRPNAFSQEEIQVLEPVTAIVAVALLRAETEERQRELSDLKDEFVSKVSHELRTPLTSIIGAVDNLLDGIAGSLDEKPRDYLTRMKENSERLLRLINELLDLSRIEAGREELHPTRFAVAPLIRETLETLAPLAATRGVALAATDARDVELVADRDKLARVLMNLVQNAIKFTAAGGRVEVESKSADGTLTLLVRDTGSGIPPTELDRVFDKFHQVKVSRVTGGTGLGLPISRQLVEMHGGRLVAESRLGAGSVFTMTLPLAATLPLPAPLPWPAS
jgi:signal transduction histidine kinase